MKNITIDPLQTSEGNASNIIFNACRANPKRIEKLNVKFNPMANGSHEAVLRDSEGIVIAMAEVDEFDV